MSACLYCQHFLLLACCDDVALMPKEELYYWLGRYEPIEDEI